MPPAAPASCRRIVGGLALGAGVFRLLRAHVDPALRPHVIVTVGLGGCCEGGRDRGSSGTGEGGAGPTAVVDLLVQRVCD